MSSPSTKNRSPEEISRDLGLPASPAAYGPLVAEIAAVEGPDRDGRIRALAERDFWFFCKAVASLKDYHIHDPHHPNCGGLYVDDPFVFAKCRELQWSVVTAERGVFYNWSRFYLKTELITKNLTLWELGNDPQLTFCLLTYKVDETGQAIYQHLRSELESNLDLQRLYPELYPIKRSTVTSLTVNRALGPKEASISIHPLSHMPTSQHFNRIVVDDAVVQDTVTNQEMIAKTISWLRLTTALKSDFTIDRYIGTIWDNYDPHMTLIREGFFSRRDHVTPYDEDGEPVLRSKEFLEEWRRMLGPYHWSSQMEGNPVSRGEQVFDESWLDIRYENDPHEEAKGKNVYVFCDFASGESTKAGDYIVFAVLGLGEDGLTYILDIRRDRTPLSESIEDLFRLVKVWKPVAVYVESFGDSAHYSYIKREMELERFRFKLRKLPQIARSKEFRIQALQPLFKRGKYIFPATGFGHGSRIDDRDTLQQLFEDELRVWSPIKGSTLHDDILDTLAWSAQKEVFLRYPQSFAGETADALYSLGGSAEKRKSLFERVSWVGY